MPWSRRFENPIPLPDDSPTVGRYERSETRPATSWHYRAKPGNRMNGSGDRGAIDGGGKPRAADACAHRYVESAEPKRRTDV